ncbi:MAG: V-type ATP synthase subunit B [Pseudomonadota bacterium]
MRADLYVTGAAKRIEGPLLFLRRSIAVGLNDAVEVIGADGRARLGRISTLDEKFMTIEVLEPTSGLSIPSTRVRFFGEPIHFSVGPGILGRVFDGVGRPIDGGPPIPAEADLPVEGRAINPALRGVPKDFIQTSITAVDLMNSLIRGQKLPIFSAGGLPHDRIAVEIAGNARLLGSETESFAIVFVGIGISHDTAEHFRHALEMSGALERTALFLNLASDSSTQRLLTPRFALTAAEYLAFHEGRHVLVIMTDMTNYCEALREVSASHGEIPSRKGYPGYMYSDLASIYERAGRIENQPGTLTQLPILTMPGDDITHPIPDLTGYITEGQIVLDRNLNRRSIYPPVDVLASLSRLMKDGIGEGYTAPDHPALATQLYASYARAVQVRTLSSIVGQEGLTELDRTYLEFGKRFEETLIHQDGPRSLDESMEIGWEILSLLPSSELTRLNEAQIAKHIEEKHHA